MGTTHTSGLQPALRPCNMECSSQFQWELYSTSAKPWVILLTNASMSIAAAKDKRQLQQSWQSHCFQPIKELIINNHHVTFYQANHGQLFARNVQLTATFVINVCFTFYSKALFLRCV